MSYQRELVVDSEESESTHRLIREEKYKGFIIRYHVEEYHYKQKPWYDTDNVVHIVCFNPADGDFFDEHSPKVNKLRAILGQFDEKDISAILGDDKAGLFPGSSNCSLGYNEVVVGFYTYESEYVGPLEALVKKAIDQYHAALLSE